MKRFFNVITAVVLAMLIGALPTFRVLAESSTDYISEVKIGMGKTADEAKAALAGYAILDVDLNQGAGGGLG